MFSRQIVYFLAFDLPAFDSAMATACFCGFFSLINVFMLALMVLSELPFLSGMDYPLSFSFEIRSSFSLLPRLEPNSNE